MELLEVMSRAESTVADFAAQGDRQSGTSFLIGVTYCRLVDDFEFRQLAIVSGPRSTGIDGVRSELPKTSSM